MQRAVPAAGHRQRHHLTGPDAQPQVREEAARMRGHQRPQQAARSSPAVALSLQRAAGNAAVTALLLAASSDVAAGTPVIQRKVECNLEPIEKECVDAAGSCATVKDYCAAKYPKPNDIDKLHADAVTGAGAYRSKTPHAAANLLHFLDGTGTEKVMDVDVFRNHEATKRKYGEHLAKFLAGAKRRYESGELKIGGPAVEMVWTDTANAFGMESDLGLAVGGYTVCSKVSATAKKPGDVGGSEDFLWVVFEPWTMQAFDCYNWDPGKGIGLGFATDNDLCCLENAGRGKHFHIRTDPWPITGYTIQSIALAAPKHPAKPPAPPPPKPPTSER